MKESKKSLKTFFIVIGILGVILNLWIFISLDNNLGRIIGLISLAVPALYIYFGIKLYDYLERSPKMITNFVVVAATLSVISYLLSQYYLEAIIAFLIGWYLVHNVKKLSQNGANM